MEFTLNVALVRGILRGERRQALADIAAGGVVAALADSQRRHDARIAAAADLGTLACRPGCSWCCHFSVDVRAAEVFRILDYVQQTWTPSRRATLIEQLKDNATRLHGLGAEQRATLNLRCPFLGDDRCGIYEVRPQTCRNYHATDAAGCRQSCEEPENLEIDPEFAPEVYQAGTAHVEAFCAALRQAGYDADVYELNVALVTALAEPQARARLEQRGRPFAALAGEPVAAEFDQLDDDSGGGD
jgi:Fe-S-cluster containining protein